MSIDLKMFDLYRYMGSGSSSLFFNGNGYLSGERGKINEGGVEDYHW